MFSSASCCCPGLLRSGRAVPPAGPTGRPGVCVSLQLQRRPPLTHHQNSPDLLTMAAGDGPTWNPQNVDQPRVLPSPEFSPAECVAVQLDALSSCNDPWPSHGIHTAYEFGYDIGGLDPSWYFGFRKDLYHLDHFMGLFQSHLPELMNLSSYEVEGVEDGDDAEDRPYVVSVVVKDSSGGKEAQFKFHLKRKRVGPRKGALATAMIERC